jgi:hypothetical protein
MRFTLRLYSRVLRNLTRPVLDWLHQTSPSDRRKSQKPNVTLPGTVEKIIASPHPSEPEKAQISVKDGDDLYKEIRIENALQDEDGNEVALKEGAEVDVTVEADKKDTTPKS